MLEASQVLQIPHSYPCTHAYFLPGYRQESDEEGRTSFNTVVTVFTVTRAPSVEFAKFLGVKGLEISRMVISYITYMPYMIDILGDMMIRLIS